MLWYKTVAVVIRGWGTAKIHVLWSLSDRLMTGRSRVGWRWFVRYTISIYLDPWDRPGGCWGRVQRRSMYCRHLADQARLSLSESLAELIFADQDEMTYTTLDLFADVTDAC
jgi:hypothetical protein